MKLNDMTIADIEQAAAQNAEAYDTMFQKMAGDDFYMLTEEVSGIPVIFEYKMSTGALFFCDALIPYPVALLSQMKAVFKVMGVQRELRS